MFAVIKTGGKQYRVIAGELVKVEKVAGNTGDIVEFTEVLMIGEGVDAAIGMPVVDGALVTAEIVEQGRARKVIAFKKRRRQNSRRTRGHRQELTTVRISEILTDGAKPEKVAAPAKAEAVAEEKAASKKAQVETVEKKAAARYLNACCSRLKAAQTYPMDTIKHIMLNNSTWHIPKLIRRFEAMKTAFL